MSYIYVIEFDSGLIKVGRTTKPEQRINCHKGNVYSISKAAIKNQWVSVHHTNPDENESRLISFCAGMSDATAKRTEWFSGIKFSDVVSYAETLFYDQEPKNKIGPAATAETLNGLFGNPVEQRHVALSYQCAYSLQKFINDSLWIGGDIFVVSETFGSTPFVIVVGAYFASGSPTEMLIEAVADISEDPEKEIEAVLGLFNKALDYAKLWNKEAV